MSAVRPLLLFSSPALRGGACGRRRTRRPSVFPALQGIARDTHAIVTLGGLTPAGSGRARSLSLLYKQSSSSSAPFPFLLPPLIRLTTPPWRRAAIFYSDGWCRPPLQLGGRAPLFHPLRGGQGAPLPAPGLVSHRPLVLPPSGRSAYECLADAGGAPLLPCLLSCPPPPLSPPRVVVVEARARGPPAWGGLRRA